MLGFMRYCSNKPYVPFLCVHNHNLGAFEPGARRCGPVLIGDSLSRWLLALWYLRLHQVSLLDLPSLSTRTHRRLASRSRQVPADQPAGSYLTDRSDPTVRSQYGSTRQYGSMGASTRRTQRLRIVFVAPVMRIKWTDSNDRDGESGWRGRC